MLVTQLARERRSLHSARPPARPSQLPRGGRPLPPGRAPAPVTGREGQAARPRVVHTAPAVRSTAGSRGSVPYEVGEGYADRIGYPDKSVEEW